MGQVEGPAALAFLFRRFGGGLLHEVGEVRDTRLVRDIEGEGVGRSKHMLAILQAEEREFLHELAVGLLVGGGEVGAAPGEIPVGVDQQLVLVGLQPEAVALSVDGLDTPEESLVEGDIHLVLGHQGREILGDLLHLVVGIGFEQVVEDAAHAVQGLAGSFQGLDGVRESRRIGVGHDGVDFGLRLGDGLLEGGLVMLGPDPVERRCAVGKAGFGQQGIFHSTRKDCKHYACQKGNMSHEWVTACLVSVSRHRRRCGPVREVCGCSGDSGAGTGRS